MSITTRLDLEIENAELKLANLQRMHAISVYDREDARTNWLTAIDEYAAACKTLANLRVDASHEEHTLELLNVTTALAEHHRCGGEHAVKQLNVERFAGECTAQRRRVVELKERRARVETN